MDLADPVRGDRRALRQNVASGQPVAHRAAAGPVQAEDAAQSSAGQCQGAGGLSKKGLRNALKAAAAAHPERRLQLWFQDEARIGQKGRTAHRWWVRGERPAGLCDKRFTSAYLYAAVCPTSGGAFALVLPTLSTAAMTLFLDGFSKKIGRAHV